MARTGPQKIPGASQAYFYGTGRYSGSAMEVNCGVAHTTEGRTVPTYGGGAQAPTVTGLPDFKAKKIRWYQHYDVDESARALMNKLGGVETNTANAFQIELVGTCDAKNAKTWGGKTAGVDYIYWPDAPEWALAEVAWLVRWLHDYHRVPLTCVKDWLAYGKDARRPGVTPASYGASPARMSMAAWRKFTGWCGHQHVPENDHGDPGSMDFARVIALAKGDNAPTTPPKNDKPPAPAPVVPVEDPMPAPTTLHESVAGGPDLPAGEWTELPAAEDTAILRGPCTYDVGVSATLSGTGDAGRVQMRFVHVDIETRRRSAALPVDVYVRGGDTGTQVSRRGALPAGQYLKVEALADGVGATVTHRTVDGLVWR
ncbi:MULTISPECIES: hypothetical protein [unclassified Streptomyces]|uniref:hypothetical protein n=1 Tax=unclassified Streptomyces TaxID=2593676 RepID=UPI0007C75A65|nr:MULTISPECIES: hypothetical protein [unclassified Streptomyces]